MTDNPAIPDKSILFKPVRDTYGNRLALVFGNEFVNGECPFYTAKQCHHCDIGAGEGTQFNTKMNKERLDFFKRYYGDILKDVEHLVVYNSGSILNRAEMSRQTLEYIAEYASSLERCKIVSFDSREMYLTKDSLDYIIERLREDQQARVILGVESQSDEVRIGKLNKTMLKEKIERAFEVTGRYRGKVGINFNIVFQPPELVGEDAIREAVETLRYGLDLGERYNVSVDFNFHPYYPSKRSRARYSDHPRANLEDSKEALRRMKTEVKIRDSDAKIFIGWQDEEHDQQQELRGVELKQGMEKFDGFNITQDVISIF